MCVCVCLCVCVCVCKLAHLKISNINKYSRRLNIFSASCLCVRFSR